MKQAVVIIYAFLLASFSNLALAVVDESSSAYKSGYIVGRVFIIILAVLIIRKVFFSKK